MVRHHCVRITEETFIVDMRRAFNLPRLVATQHGVKATLYFDRDKLLLRKLSKGPGIPMQGETGLYHLNDMKFHPSNTMNLVSPPLEIVQLCLRERKLFALFQQPRHPLNAIFLKLLAEIRLRPP
jgi:hypothetical protein